MQICVSCAIAYACVCLWFRVIVSSHICLLSRACSRFEMDRTILEPDYLIHPVTFNKGNTSKVVGDVYEV